MIFDGYELKDYIVRSLKDLKFTSFTPVQKEVFNEIKSGKNILAKSKTGSGKTHAFLIPIFNDLDINSNDIFATIIAPTRELASQIYKMAQHIASFSDKTINIKLFVSGSDREREIEKLNKSQPHIVIGTPGKIKDLSITTNALKVYTSKYVVVDEVDMTFQEGFLDDVIAVFDKVCAGRVFTSSYMVLCALIICDQHKVEQADEVIEKMKDIMICRWLR